MNANPQAAFRAFITSHGYGEPERLEPGVFARVSTKPNDARNKDASVKLFPDQRGGIVCDFTTGQTHVWQAEPSRAYTPAEVSAWRERIEREGKAAAEQRKRDVEEVSERARRIFDKAEPADDSFPYFTTKGVKRHGALKLYRGTLALNGMRCDGALTVPMRDATGELVSLQFIDAKGEKRYLNGPKPKGAYYAIGKPAGTLVVCEGYATGASIHESTGLAVAVAFDAGNLTATAQALRLKYPDARLILAADNDVKPEGGNRGIEAATEAARVVGGLLAVPDMGGIRCDFNDLAQAQGPEAVKRAIEAAAAPDTETPQTIPANVASAILASPTEAAEGWPEPGALPDSLPPVEPFGPELLPEALAGWCMDVAERMGAPADFLGVTILAALGSLVGRKLAVRPQEKTDWQETCNQWAVIVGRPGAMKSPAQAEVLAPLERLQRRSDAQYADAIQEYERALGMVKLRREAADGEKRKLLKGNINASIGHLEVAEPDRPKRRRYQVNDSTYQAIAEIHADNPNGVLVNRDELVSLLKSLDREDSCEARGFYLTAWSGKASYSLDRISREAASLEGVCISLVGSTQPGRIASYLREAVSGGNGDDGLIQRFGLLVWPDPREWRDVDRDPDREAEARAFEVYEALDTLTPESVGAEQDRNQNGEPKGLPYLRFSNDALEVFREWRTVFEARIGKGDEVPALESHFAKYRKLIPSLALLLHLAGGGKGPIARAPTLRALAWAEYLETHARRAYASVTTPETGAAKAIVKRLRCGDLSTTFRARDVYRKQWAGLADRKLVHDALELLVDLGWLAKIERKADLGRTPVEYVANPRGLA